MSNVLGARRPAAALVATFAVVAALGLTAAPASATDGTAPTLTGISVVGQTGATPYDVNTTTGDGSVGITIAATDAGGSGLSSADVTVSCTTGCAGGGDSEETGSAFFNGDGVSSGSATAQIDIPQTAQTGTWTVTDVDISDNGGNDTDVTALSSFTHRSFTVSHTADSHGPGLTGITFPGGINTFNVTTDDADVSLLVHATDPVPGVQSGAVTMTNGSDELEFDFDSSDLQNGTMFDGTFETEPQTIGYSEAGTWTVESITLTDGYGNVSHPTSSATFHVNATVDNAAPVVSGTPTLSPSSVNTTSSEVTTTLTIHITDAGSGFTSGFGEYTDADFDTVEFFFDPSNLVSGTVNDGTYAVPVDVDARQPSGTYHVDSVDLSDRAGNDNFIDSPAWPALTVTSAADSTGPQLGSMTASPSPLNISDNDFRTISLAATITDATSGFDHADVTFTDGGGNEVDASSLFSSDPDFGTQHSGNTWVAQFSPSDEGTQVAGTWHVTRVDLFDRAGNQTTVTSGLPSFVVQTTPSADTTAPTVTAVSLSPATVSTVDGDATVHATVTLTDTGTGGGPASGISFASVNLTAPDGNHFADGGFLSPDDLVSGNDTSGTYAFDFTIPKYAPTGSWSFSDITVDDNAGNETELGSGQIAPLGTHQVTVSGPVDTTHPVLHSVTADAATVNTTTSQNLTFTVAAIDQDDTNHPGSGLQSGEVILTSPSGQQVFGDFGEFEGQASGTPQDGTWTTKVRFPKFAQSGTWGVSVDLVDNLGNDVTYATTDIVALGDSNTSSVSVTGAADTKAPVAKAIVFNPASVNSSSGATTLLVDVHLTDNQATSDGSGVDDATIDLTSPHGTQDDLFSGLNLVAGTATDGWYEASFEIPQFVDSGTWKISALDVTDAEQNEVDYDQAALTAANLPTGVNITGSADTAAPTVTSLAPPTTTVDVRTTPQTITIPVGISDTNGSGGAGSGATDVSITVTGPNGATEFGFTSSLKTGTATAGTWEVPVDIPQFTDNGTWHITEVDTEDEFGNQAEITSFGAQPTAFTVESSPDTTPPTATALTLAPTTAEVSGGPVNVVATVSAKDTGAGLQGGFIQLTGPHGQDASGTISGAPVTGTANNGTFKATITIPQYSEAGTWTVTDLELDDQADNFVDYSADGGTPFPFTPPTVTVTDAHPDTVAPTVTGITVTPSPVDLSGGLTQVKFDLHATDALSGTTDVEFTVQSPSGVETQYDADTLATGTGQDGHWTAKVDFPVSSEDGTWKITEVDTSDAAGNFGTDATPPATNSFTVVNGVATVPGAPGEVDATPGVRSADLTWFAPDSNGGAAVTGYKVETSSNGGTTWSAPVATGSADTGFTVTGLSNGTAYQFRVAAVNSVGTGAFSSASNTVTPSASAPGAPTNVTGTPGNQQVLLSWSAPADNGGDAITGYKLERSTDNGATWSAPTTVSGTSTTVTGLTNGTGYLFRVAATNDVGTGNYSAPSAKLTPATTPGTPSAVVGTAGDTEVALHWTAPGSNGGSAITGYSVESSSDGGHTWSAPKPTGGTTTSYTLGGLTNGTHYVFRVAAQNAVGTGSYSAASAAVTPHGAATTPAAPTAVAGTAGDTEVALHWTAPASNGGSAITGYFAESSSDGGHTWSAPRATGSTTTSYTFGGLTNGTAYVFRVAAKNAIGTGNYSSPSASITPVAATPTPDASSLSIGRSTTIKYGGKVTVSTTLKDTTSGAAVPGASVQLMARTSTHGAFAPVKTLTTSSAGKASLKVKPLRMTQYRWEYAGDDAHAAATSGVQTVKVAQVVSAAVTSGKIKHGKDDTIWGTVKPSASGHKVTVQVLRHGKWVKVGKAKVKKQKLPNGKKQVGYALKFTEKKGKYKLRVVIGATSKLAAGTSKTVKVKFT